MGLRVACQSKPKPANQLKTKLKKRKKQHRSSLTVRSLFSASFNDSGLQNSIRLARPSFGLGIHTLFVFLLLYFNIRFVFFLVKPNVFIIFPKDKIFVFSPLRDENEENLDLWK